MNQKRHEHAALLGCSRNLFLYWQTSNLAATPYLRSLAGACIGNATDAHLVYCVGVRIANAAVR
ncbi:MAG: hypothetical protein HFJ65_06170 [Eggerthellaceae bacterium]|nr:hypothetical protein [Eggerthellaceae bacterium]